MSNRNNTIQLTNTERELYGNNLLTVDDVNHETLNKTIVGDCLECIKKIKGK